MQKLTILNTREIKRIKEILNQNFGYSLKKDYAYLMNEKDRIFIINKDISKINLKNLRIDKIGLYFAEYKNTQVRLSKEGAQLLVKEAEKNKKELKNIIQLTETEIKEYFQGNELKKDLGKESKFILLKYKDDTIGCAKYKENTIINFLPKIHRGEVIT